LDARGHLPGSGSSRGRRGAGEICGPRVQRLGMLRAPGAEGAWWDARQREVVCIPKYPGGKLERERERKEKARVRTAEEECENCVSLP